MRDPLPLSDLLQEFARATISAGGPDLVKRQDLRRLLKVERIPVRAWPEGFWMTECVERAEGEALAAYLTLCVNNNIRVSIDELEYII